MSRPIPRTKYGTCEGALTQLAALGHSRASACAVLGWGWTTFQEIEKDFPHIKFSKLYRAPKDDS